MASKLYWAIVKDYVDNTMSEQTGRIIQSYDCLESYTIYEDQNEAMDKCKEIFDHFFKIDSKWIGQNNVAFEYYTRTHEDNEITITFRITAIYTNI